MSTATRKPRERGMLLSGPMVLARLAGRKKQSRRLLEWRGLAAGLNLGSSSLEVTRTHEDAWRLTSRGPGTCWEDRSADTPCPHGIEGDKIWWREAWRTAASLDGLSGQDIAEKSLAAGYSTPWAPIQYEADGFRNGCWSGFGSGNGAPPPQPGRYRHARFMPRWAARLVDDLIDVRPERLIAITDGPRPTVPGSRCWGHAGVPRAAGTPTSACEHAIPGRPSDRPSTRRRAGRPAAAVRRCPRRWHPRARGPSRQGTGAFPMTDKSDDEPKLLHCSDKCGAAIPATEKALLSSGWTYLETARRFRCGACMRALAAAATLPGTSLAASVDTLPRNSIGALKKPTADTIVPPVVKP